MPYSSRLVGAIVVARKAAISRAFWLVFALIVDGG
jgi:hypothetical protein